MPSVKNGEKQITDIRYLGSNVVLELDGIGVLEISLNAYVSFDPFVKGQWLDENQITALERANEQERLLEIAYALLEKKLYTCKQMNSRLMKVCDDATLVYEVIAKLIAKNYLNDAYFAQKVATQYYEKQKGWNYIEEHLLHDGISEEIIHLTRQKLKEEFEEKVAQTVVKKALQAKSSKNYMQRKASVYQLLVRNGFDEELVHSIMESYHAKFDQEDEKAKAKKELLRLLKKKDAAQDKKKLIQKIYQTLMNKGYRSGMIKEILEEVEHD